MITYRIIPKLLCGVMAFLLLIPAAALVCAQDGGLHETFDSPNPTGWEFPPEVTVTDGVLRIPGGAGAFYNCMLANFTLSIRARFTSGQGELTLSYRATAGRAYHALIGPGYAMLNGINGESLGGNGFAPPEGWFEIGVSAHGDQHTISIDGVPVLTAVDATHLASGAMDFHVTGEVVVEFDDLIISEADNIAQSLSTSGGSSTTTGSGAAYTAASWVRLGGPPGGLGYDIRMRPDHPDEMYVTDAHAGIFKSVDGGVTWQTANTGLPYFPGAGYPVFCATIDPHNYDTVWIGTQVVGHLYRSTDAGQTWEARDNGITHDGRSLRGITIDPNDANVVYVGLEVEAGKWQQEHPEAEANVVGGEVYKSIDAGLNWTRIWQGQNVARYVWIDPRNSNRVYVSTGIFDRVPANAHPEVDDPGGIGILRSDDAGQTWTILDERNGLGGRIVPSLFMHPTNPDILIAAIYIGESPGVFVTRDGGDTWEQVLHYFAHNVEIATSDPDIWYTAGEDVIYRSDDAGQTWQKFELKTPDRGSGMPIDLQVDPRDPYRIFVNNYGGSNFVSTDGGATWVDASQGYTGAMVRGIWTLPDGTIFVGGDFRSDDGGRTWVAPTIVEGTAVPTTSPANDLMVAKSAVVIHSTDGGLTWSAWPVTDLDAEVRAGRLSVGKEVFASQLAVAPSDPQTVYLGFSDPACNWGSCLTRTLGFFRSHDAGYTWESLPGAPFDPLSIMRIAIHPQDSRKVYVATPMGLYLSEDGGNNWQRVTSLNEAAERVTVLEVTPAAQLPDMFVTLDVAFDPFDPNIMYVVVLDKGLFRSSDGGVTWQPAGYGLDPNEPVRVILPDPNNPGVIYAGSAASGAFVSTDGGQSWQLIGNGLVVKSILSLALSDDSSILYAGTFGDGIWRLGGS
jgi:photosystem II stability/assembly factor-like uncharacterized protein